MKRSSVTTLAVLALLLTASFALSADAAEPKRRTWAPYDLGAPVSALALARDEGSAMYAGLAPPNPCDPSGASGSTGQGVARCVYLNQVRLDHATGPMFPMRDVNGNPVPNNESLAATKTRSGIGIAADGRSWVAIENHNGEDPPRPNVYYGGSAHPAWTQILRGIPQDVAMSADGSLIAVASGTAELGYRMIAWSSLGFTTTDWRVAGPITSVAVSGDGQWIVAGGVEIIEDTVTAPVVHLFKLRGTAPVFTWTGTAANFSEVSTVSISRDGLRFAAGLRGGGVVFFENAGAQTARGATVLAAGTTPVREIAMSDDGVRAYVAHGQGIAAFEVKGRVHQRVWNFTAANGFNDVATTGTGDLVLAAGPSGLYGFPMDEATPLFRTVGAYSQVEVNRNGSRAAYARGGVVDAGVLLPRLAFGYPGPADEPMSVPTEVPRIAAQSSRVMNLVIENQGIRGDRVRLALPTSFEAKFSLNATEIDVPPAGSRKVALTITPSLEARPGDYAYNMSATSLVTGERVNLTIPFAIPQTLSFQLTLAGNTNRSLLRGQTEEVSVVLDNRASNDEALVRLAAVQAPSAGPEWLVQGIPLDPVPIPRGSLQTYRVRITVPGNTPNGTTNAIAIYADAEGQGTATSETMFYTVNPVIGVNVTTPSRLKLVPPGERVIMAVTVGNNGTVPATYVLSYEVKAANGRIWNVELPPLAFTGFDLPPGTSQTFNAKIAPPPKATADDQVVITFNVESLHANQLIKPAHWSVTTYVHVQNRAPEPKLIGEREAPGAPLALLVLGIAAVSLALRRRESS